MDSEKKNSNSTTHRKILLTDFNRDKLIKQSSRKISRRSFINAINYVHFVQGNLFAHMYSLSENKEVLVNVEPEPCDGTKVLCRILDDADVNLTDYRLCNLIVDDGKAISLMPVTTIELGKSYFWGNLQEKGYVFTERQGKRFRCRMVSAKIKQGSIETGGMLEDFALFALRIILNKDDEVSPRSFDENQDLSLSLYREGHLIFSGLCNIVRGNTKSSSIILRPFNFNQNRFNERKNRNPRLNLIPTPKVIFKHPFNNKRVTYEIFDLTTAGFSINESVPDALMVPGLIIPDITIVYAGGLKLKCSAQVVYGLEQKKSTMRFGFAIYDMDIMTYNKLFDIFSNANDIHANVTSDVDMDALWEFFFESGFIYPKKYETISKYKEEFKQTYRRLYHDSQDIFANFTYQQNGIIYGHVSILKAYENTWMIHHLAAKSMGRKRTGLYVLNHILNYFDGLYRMPSVGMDYMIFYFRPNNRFPDYFFGGFCRELNNPQACSMDCFAYLNCSIYQEETTLPERWSLQESTHEDIKELRDWYYTVSGGLMLDALCIDNVVKHNESLESMYNSHGLKRKWFSKVLKYDGTLKAFFIVDQSDKGINLSELLNSIKIIVVNDDHLTWGILLRAISSAASLYKTENIPVMVYPYAYMDDNKIPYDKKYNLWALNAQFGDDYTEHLKKKAKINIIKFMYKYMKAMLLRR